MAYENTLVKNPIFWTSIAAVVAILILLCFVLSSMKHKEDKKTTISTIDVRSSEDNNKDVFNEEEFLDTVMQKVDDKIDKHNKNIDGNAHKQLKEQMDEIMKMFDEQKKKDEKIISSFNQKLQPLIEKTINEQFSTGMGNTEMGEKFAQIKDALKQDINEALDSAKKYTDDKQNMFWDFILTDDKFKNAIINAIVEELNNYEHDKNSQSKLCTAVQNAIINTINAVRPLGAYARITITDNQTNNKKKAFKVSKQNILDIEKMIHDQLQKGETKQKIELKPEDGKGPNYIVDNKNINNIPSTLSLALFQHPSLFSSNFSQGQ